MGCCNWHGGADSITAEAGREQPGRMISLSLGNIKWHNAIADNWLRSTGSMTVASAHMAIIIRTLFGAPNACGLFTPVALEKLVAHLGEETRR